MPTGYTAGILDGKINSFKEYALTCAKAMGALVHMRDEPLNSGITRPILSNFHKTKIMEINNKIEFLRNGSNEVIYYESRQKIKDEIQRYKRIISETTENRSKLQFILSEVQDYLPPTKDHVRYKEFMIQQLEDTIDMDGDTTYYEEKINELEDTLKNFNIDKYKENQLANLHKELKYHIRENEEEISRIKQRNNWIDELLKSLMAEEN